MIAVFSSPNLKDEIFKKDYIASPVHKKNPEEKVIPIDTYSFVRMQIK
jgi:hypothetical protein